MNDDIRYEVILYWSDADKAFIAEVPELPGCAADGSTYREALDEVGEPARALRGRRTRGAMVNAQN